MMADDSRLRGRFLMRVGMASGVERHEVRASLAGLLPTQAMSPPGDSEAVGDEEFRATLLEAEQGDVDAMYRVAVMYENGTNSVPKDTDAMLRWLVVSSALGNGLASYKLYRLYNAERRTLADAIRFKSLAKKQGYTGPPGLSLRR